VRFVFAVVKYPLFDAFYLVDRPVDFFDTIISLSHLAEKGMQF
jgi:hypothetical protein